MCRLLQYWLIMGCCGRRLPFLCFQCVLSACIQSKEESYLFGIQKGKHPRADEREKTLKKNLVRPWNGDWLKNKKAGLWGWDWMELSWHSGILVGTLRAGEMVGIEKMGINKRVLWFPWSSYSGPAGRKGIDKEKPETSYTKRRKKKVRSGVRRHSLNKTTHSKREKSALIGPIECYNWILSLPHSPCVIQWV